MNTLIIPDEAASRYGEHEETTALKGQLTSLTTFSKKKAALRDQKNVNLVSLKSLSRAFPPYNVPLGRVSGRDLYESFQAWAPQYLCSSLIHPHH